MDHHFVPRFYLGTFCDPATPPGQDAWVWVADLKGQRVQRRAPKNVARKTDYYAIPDPSGEKTQAIEQMLSRIESDAAPVVGRLLKGQFDLTHQHRVDLAHLMASLATRGPSFRENVEDFTAQVAKKMMLVSAHHRAHFEHTLRKANPDTELTAEQVERARQEILAGKWEIEANPVASLLPFLQVAATILPLLVDMEWTFLLPTGPTSFLTCDTPLSWIDPTLPPGSPFGAGGVGMANVEVTCPIAPRLCLLATWRAGLAGQAEVDDGLVDELNRRRVLFASQHVFSDSQEGAGRALEIFNSHRPGDSARPRPE